MKWENREGILFRAHCHNSPVKQAALEDQKSGKQSEFQGCLKGSLEKRRRNWVFCSAQVEQVKKRETYLQSFLDWRGIEKRVRPFSAVHRKRAGSKVTIWNQRNSHKTKENPPWEWHGSKISAQSGCVPSILGDFQNLCRTRPWTTLNFEPPSGDRQNHLQEPLAN